MENRTPGRDITSTAEPQLEPTKEQGMPTRRAFCGRKGKFLALVAIAAVLGTVVSFSGATWAQPAKDQSLQAFMRKKLEASSKILEGLTEENKDLIHQGAEAMLEMSKSEKWNVLLDDDYREFNREFRAAVRKVDAAAQKENFDGAALQWFDAVKSCMECHKYVRGARPIAK